MSSRRQEEYTCVICLESLFDARDDLDDVMPIVSTQCGHVFHRECINAATKASGERWLQLQFEQEPDTTYTLSDAPAECPSCRAEIFADEQSGEPEFVRLYLAQAHSHTQSSSPVSKRRQADEPAYALARRAKSVRELTDRLSVHSQVGDVHFAVERAQAVVDDGISDPALSSVKNHVQALAASILSLSASLRSNPLIAELQAAHAVLESTLVAERRAHKRLRDTELPGAIRNAAHAERARLGEIIKKEQAEKDRYALELDKERAARRAVVMGWEDKVISLKGEVAALKRALENEVENSKETERKLRERTALVKSYQAKLDSRKHLKDNVKELEQANEVLRRQLDQTGHSRGPDAEMVLSDDLPGFDDQWQSQRHGADDSLQVDLPTSSPSPARHPTARVIACDLNTGPGIAKRKRDDGVLKPSNRLNPFATTKSAGEKKKVLPPATTPVSADKKHPRRSIIDLTETSPDEPRPSTARRSKFFDPDSPFVARAPALADKLGIRDAHGRPSKGVASGPRVGRR